MRTNTRIYSCILVRNDLDHRWRGRYNEDTDLSIRVLKDGMCTILFNAFLMDKATTMTMSGGNTDSVYADTPDARLAFAQSLEKQHPDIVKTVARYGRWHHQVDYRPFKGNMLRPVVTDSDPESAPRIALVDSQHSVNGCMELHSHAQAPPGYGIFADTA